jgi:hypothetical protein
MLNCSISNHPDLLAAGGFRPPPPLTPAGEEGPIHALVNCHWRQHFSVSNALKNEPEIFVPDSDLNLDPDSDLVPNPII